MKTKLLILISCAVLLTACVTKHDPNNLFINYSNSDDITLAEVQTAIKNGADINNADKNKETPLMYAVEHNSDPKVIEALIKAGADVNAIDKFNNTPLVYAGYNTKANFINILLKAGAKIDFHGAGYKALLHTTSEEDSNIGKVKTLLQAGVSPIPPKTYSPTDSGKNTPLMNAVEQYHLKIVNILLKAGADVNAQGDYGKTALFYAIKGEYKDKVEPQTAIIKALLKAGADVKIKDTKGNTALSGVLNWCSSNCKNKVSLLIDAGANINVTNKEGQNLLYILISDDKMVKYLIQKGINVNHADENGNPPMMNIYNNVKSLKLLLKAGAKVNAQNKEGKTILMQALDSSDDYMIDMLHIVIRRSNINIRDNKGMTAIYYAGHPKNLKLLLRARAKINITDKLGETPLLYAIKHDAPYKNDITSILIKAGAKVNIRDKAGKTALQYAKDYSDNEVVIKLLKRAGAK